MASRRPGSFTETVLTTLAARAPMSAGELAAALGVAPIGVREVLEHLRKTRRVVPVGTRLEEAPLSSWQPGRQVRQTVWAVAGER